MSLKSVGKAVVFAALGALSAGLGACGMDDIQLNGKVFDAVGLNSTGSTNKEPKLAARQPLVMPPGMESEALPAPGSGPTGQSSLAEIQDPDRKKHVSQSDLQKKQDAYCKVHYEDAKARGDETAVTASGPLGSCAPSIFNAVKKWNQGDAPEEDTETQ
ncbi:hypothetical protein DLM45_11520 [Hyphomicrobium methylovorum]|uniref:hypothetical protein n=1 Tax=Hyphomicrobium methylovorum TaxID=84 RepID=UPI0015E6AFB4|nr:hypothetical protein [Hyphomicrobium methylovorum]MBA2126842.1 hypothetical protein [Hyphomicrobium methylovorum]